jgi:hypothetical protein
LDPTNLHGWSVLYDSSAAQMLRFHGIRGKMTDFKKKTVLCLFILCATASWLQASSLTLGTGASIPSGTVSLPLSWTADGGSVSSLQWTLTFSPGDFSGIQIMPGPAATQAGKSIQCRATSATAYTCVLTGMNATQISDGVVANAVMTVAASGASASAAVGVVGATGASPEGDGGAVAGVGNSVTIANVAQVGSVGCSPSSIRVGETANCTVTLTQAAPAGGANVSLGQASSQGIAATMPASLSIPAGMASGTFQVVVTAANSSANLAIAATLNGVSKTYSLPVLVTSVSVAPASATLYAGGTAQFTATVSNASNTAVAWSISPAIGSISSMGLYTAPAVISSAQAVSVKATSVADGTKVAVATINLAPPAPVVVSVSPSGVTLGQSQQQQFNASVTGTANTGVTWSVSPAVGSISPMGIYAAPSSIAGAQTVIVRATSLADATKSATATVTLIPDLVAFWPLNEGSGTTTADASGNGRNAQVVGASWATGFSGNALSFNGASTYADAGPFNVTGTAVTIAAWFKASTLPDTDPRIVSKATGASEQDHYFMVSTTNASGARLRFRLKTGGSTKTLIASSQTVPAGQWVHMAATYDGATMRLYQNGVQVGSMPASGNIDGNSSAPVCIGANPNAYGVFNGLIDDVRLYSRAMSAADIAVLANAAPTTVAVTVTPASASIPAGTTKQFSAAVTGTTNTATTWSVTPAVGTISSTGLYTAPASATTTQMVTIRATSVADTTKSATATLVINPVTAVTIAVAPVTASLLPSQAKQFTASVTGTTNTAVNWTISPAIGAISSAGLYTAPASVTSTQAISVRATSAADATKYAVATVLVNPQPDTTAPRISTIVRIPAGTSAVITWVTNEPSSSQVEFGTSNTTLDRVASDPALVTAHAVTLPALQRSTAYYFRVRSVDAAGNAAAYPITNSTLSFKTQRDDLALGLIGYWRFNEGSGATTADSSTAGRMGTLAGATWTTGRSSYGLTFDGVDDAVNIPGFDVADSATTISAWIRVNADTLQTSDRRILSKAAGSADTDHYFMLGTTKQSGLNRLKFALKTSGSTKTLTAPANVPTGQWIHAVATYNGANMRLYMNGVEVGSMAATGSITAGNTVPVAIGRNPQGYGAFNGVLDQVRVYNRALTGGEIAEMYSTIQ